MEFYYHEVDHDVLVVAADGGLNAHTADQFVKELEKLVDAGMRKIVVDCSHLDYISSYGIAVLVRLHHALAKHNGDVKLAAVPGSVAKVLELTRMSSFFSIFPDVPRALLEFRRPDPPPP